MAVDRRARLCRWCPPEGGRGARQPLLTGDELGLLNGLAHDAWSDAYPLAEEQQRQLGELAARAWVDLVELRVVLGQVTDLLANAADDDALAWLERSGLGDAHAVAVLRHASDLDRLRGVAAAVAGLYPVYDGLRCVFCGGATEEDWFADGQGPVNDATPDLRRRLVQVPAGRVSHYTWWHEPGCHWLWAWRPHC